MLLSLLADSYKSEVGIANDEQRMLLGIALHSFLKMIEAKYFLFIHLAENTKAQGLWYFKTWT